MALIKCSECGKKISDQAERCIKCGVPIKIASKKKKESVPEDEELKYLKNYVKKDKKILVIIGCLLLVISVCFIGTKIKDSYAEKAEYSKYSEKWMKKFDGFYRSAGTSPVHLTLNEDGTSSLCYGASCTYPNFKYVYPNKLEFSGDNNYYTSCEQVCGYPDLTGRLVSGLDCYRPNGDSEFVTKMASLDFNDYIMCGEE